MIAGPVEKDPRSCSWPTRYLFDLARLDTQQQQQAGVATTAAVATVVVRIVTAQRTAYLPREATHCSFGYLPGCHQENKKKRTVLLLLRVRTRHILYVRTVYTF